MLPQYLKDSTFSSCFWSKYLCNKKKVKCTLVQALRLCTGRTVHRECRGIALLFHDNGTRRGWEVSVTPRPIFTPVKDPVPTVTGGWVGAQGRSGQVRKISPPTGIRSPDRPARSQSLYRIRYPAHNSIIVSSTYFEHPSVDPQEDLHMQFYGISFMHLYKQSDRCQDVLGGWTVGCSKHVEDTHSFISIQPLGRFSRNHNPVRRPVWLWHTASWASS